MADKYLVLCGGPEPAVVVGPFPEGYDALRLFNVPAPYTTAVGCESLEDAVEEAAWYRGPKRLAKATG